MGDNYLKPIGTWTAQKLEYLDHYLQAYRTVTKRAPDAYYLDLFAGCGDCYLRKTGWRVKGSPWRALHAVPPFSRYLFVEKNQTLAAQLEDSIVNAGIANVSVFSGDCNGSALDKVLALVPRRALSFAFLDPSGLQLNWNTVRRLAEHRIGPFKMELLILYPYDMVIKRFIGMATFASALTTFYGDETWRNAAAESARLMENSQARRKRFIDLYKGRLEGVGYKYVDDYGPMGYGDRMYYQVIFAGDNPVGQKIMRDVWSRPKAIPGQFGYRPVKRP